jgi:hypothetical protein
MKTMTTKPSSAHGQLETVLRSTLPQRGKDIQAQRVQGVAEKAACRADAPAMLLKTKEGNVLDVQFAHEEPKTAGLLLMADLGTCDAAFVAGIVNQIAVIGTQGRRFDETTSNFLLAVTRAVEPRDELEAMLAVQMGAIHSAMMAMATRLNMAQTIPQQDVAERAMNKLARTYTMQIEALKRYRTGGQQRVIVEHVTVNAGGQAIVGAVTAEGRGGSQK